MTLRALSVGVLGAPRKRVAVHANQAVSVEFKNLVALLETAIQLGRNEAWGSGAAKPTCADEPGTSDETNVPSTTLDSPSSSAMRCGGHARRCGVHNACLGCGEADAQAGGALDDRHRAHLVVRSARRSNMRGVPCRADRSRTCSW